MVIRAARPTSSNFVFKKHANIGAADAIEDKKFLAESFVDNGELAILADNDQPQCIVLGRTGSGKSALLAQLSSIKERVIAIPPEGLALTYMSDSDTLGFFITAGVNMDLFYRLLWRHVFTVEIIREHFHITSEEARDSFLQRLRDRIRPSKSRQEAFDYLMKWGESFWKDSEYRVREVTTTLERDLGASVGGVLKGVSAEATLSADLARKLSAEEKAEVIHRGQSVIDKVQMKTLADIVDLLTKELLDDKKKKYYFTIDRLDENWVNDEQRYRLIKALLDTVREFNHKLDNVKILVAIREDLLERVFRYTRDAGYQEEKYRSMYLSLTWKETELIELLDRRVSQMVREQYTKKEVSLKDLLPARIVKDEPLGYLIARTMLRPRDAIMFFNECIRAGEGKAKLTQAMVIQAEAVYSEQRLRALADEWSADYQNLLELSFFLKQFPSHFKTAVVRTRVEDSMLEFLVSKHPQDYIYQVIEEKFNSGDIDGFIAEMYKILHRVGLIGIKADGYSTTSWTFKGQKLMSADIDTDATIHIHPAFWRVLGIRLD